MTSIDPQMPFQVGERVEYTDDDIALHYCTQGTVREVEGHYLGGFDILVDLDDGSSSWFAPEELRSIGAAQ